MNPIAERLEAAVEAGLSQKTIAAKKQLIDLQTLIEAMQRKGVLRKQTYTIPSIDDLERKYYEPVRCSMQVSE